MLLEEIAAEDASPVAKVARQASVSRQAVDKQLRNLISQGIVQVEGEGKGSRYCLAVLNEKISRFRLAQGLEEHLVFRDLVLPAVSDRAASELAVLAYGFNEMLNNAIEHSEAKEVVVRVVRNASSFTVQIVDDGVGIFKKIAQAFHLSSMSEALFEVSKGKLTTEPTRHNGEGIFFTARLFDAFMLSANHLSFMHNAHVQDGWLAQSDEHEHPGTRVSMVLNFPVERSCERVFDEHVAYQGEFGFTKTHVLLKLAQFGEKMLMSRSHARRVFWRLERFGEVVLDFAGVESVGPAFIDELIRVLPGKKPKIKLTLINLNEKIERAIARTRV
jgi:anti-sigma regulatory factor (Ser/Thr protein kinase)